ncbi:MAG: hypothetical protein L6R41_003165 [Letrouitia leprolyta]|nr:MAG: hypothetical protein L6R41_003165 [Letrouitia leprolyta]
MSLIGVIILTAGYEFVRDMSRRFEASSAEYINKLPSKLSLNLPCSLRLGKGGGSILERRAKEHILQVDDDDARERRSLLWSGKSTGEAEKKQKLIKAALYAVQVFYSFFIIVLIYTPNS